MTRWTKLTALACATAALAVCAWVPPAALGAGGNAIINDCESNGQLTHTYTLKQLQRAQAVMPASVKEYTNCPDVIQQAIATAKRHHGTVPTGGSSGGSFLPTPVIVILVVLILAAVTFGAIAIRRRRGPADDLSDHPADGDPPDPGGPADGESP
jgi:hypothetical protein